MSGRALLGSALALLCAGCLQVSWSRGRRYEPVVSSALARFSTTAEGDATELGECLAALGAPLWVWEHVHEGQSGAALAYGWVDEKGLGLGVSVPVSDYYSPSLDYDQVDKRMKGLVLFFDHDWRLTAWRVGLLRDLTEEARRPPAFVDEDA